ncbi:MAG TPA: hypothetical protein VKA08_17525 [Balneolales bacterium]|nr:hypothetical protein [Balneolales bacterium]
MNDQKTTPKKKKNAGPGEDDVRQRREALKRELEELQGQIEESVGQLKGDAKTRLDISYWIDKYPLGVAGLSVVAGFLLGMKWHSDGHDIPASARKDHYLLSELKRAVTRKAIQRVIDLLDEKVDQLQKKDHTE